MTTRANPACRALVCAAWLAFAPGCGGEDEGGPPLSAEDAPPASSGGAGGRSGLGGSPPAGGTGAGGTSAPPLAGGSGAGGTSAPPPATGGQATGGAGPPPAERPPCLDDSSQIVLVGDSYINWASHTFPADINAVSGLTIANYAIGGTSMGSGGLGFIPPQFETALAAHPDIRAVILDGGGNDILVPDRLQFPQGGDCKMLGSVSPTIPDCQEIVTTAMEAGRKLFLRMAAAGVKDAVFFFYPHVPTNTVVGGIDPNGMLDYALPRIQAECASAYEQSRAADPTRTIRCHFVDMVPVFEGHLDYFALGDIHPNPTGSRKMAEAIWSRMREECVGQPASSGCCEPR